MGRLVIRLLGLLLAALAPGGAVANPLARAVLRVFRGSVVDYGRNVFNTAIGRLGFHSGVGWASNTTATFGTYNPGNRAVRITLAGTFATATAYQLRFPSMRQMRGSG